MCSGHRVIEVGCVEVVDWAVTGRVFHTFLNPGRAVDPKALAVHGVTDEFLNDKPKFEDVVRELLGFIGESVLVIHNAPFDISFLDQEFSLLRRDLQPIGALFQFVDTLAMARAMFPGMKNGLDSLCLRFDAGERVGRHNALEDARLLAHVYVRMARYRGG